MKEYTKTNMSAPAVAPAPAVASGVKSSIFSLPNDKLLRYGSIIGAVVFGSILFIYGLYLLINSVGSDSSSGGGGRRSKGSFKGYRSLDTIYDDAGGNDPLSNARLTSDINISSDKYSCKYQVIYEGNKDREINCIQGCNTDETDDNSNFCKLYEYKDGDSLTNPLLDKTFIDRKQYTESREN